MVLISHKSTVGHPPVNAWQMWKPHQEIVSAVTTAALRTTVILIRLL